MNTRISETTRRQFLRNSAAAALAFGALPAPNSSFATEGEKAASEMRFGFTTYQWGKDWDIPTLIANCTKAEAYGAEVRTSRSFAHGVELELTAVQRSEVKKQFQDSPITLVGLATSEKFDYLDPDELKTHIEDAKKYAKLSHDVGGSGIRVFPNAFHEEVPHETTIAQIGKSLNKVGKAAADYGQMVRLEAHGTAGHLPSIRAIMEHVEEPNVCVKLNSSSRDVEGEGFESNFNQVKDYLGDTIHIHNLKGTEFPYQLQVNLLTRMGWSGWVLVEQSQEVSDRVQELIDYRKIWEDLVANATL